MIAALRTEYRKLVTTRLWWVLLLVMAGYMAFLGATMGYVLSAPGAASTGMPGASPAPELDPADVARTVYSLSAALGYVFPVVVGALSVTGEFRHLTLTPTFLAEPRRTLVLGAKALATVPVGVLFGLAGAASTVLGGAAVLALRGEPTLLTDPEVLRTLGLTVLALTVWTAVGVGFGAAVPSQVGAVVVLLAFTQFVEPLLRMLLAVNEPTSGIARFLPGAAGEAITGASLYSSLGAGDLLAWWQGLLVLLGYGLLLAVIGRVTTLRRDVT
ncbi:ABC transporter permease [Actinotalea sp. M2MS4P-6]|uniref:ABC transporter permease n=1 Tax=Actinotalea sp. M2MS4P-6 TaxID=2983762 RepID=UPI0021E4A0E7|nr:ABC transporter permease [Actinotalea sp. M2MS4P-6]MCV2394119.1 ABC transporter permease [Actinotalea sp. M2MS4P-6]